MNAQEHLIEARRLREAAIAAMQGNTVHALATATFLFHESTEHVLAAGLALDPSSTFRGGAGDEGRPT